MAKEMDKLPAIAGLAHRFSQSLPNAGYAAGLWLTDLPQALLWRSTYPEKRNRYDAFEPRRPAEYRAPTWSWASLDGRITYNSQYLDASLHLELDPDFEDVPFRVITCYTDLQGRNPLGAVKAGVLRVIGRIIQLNFPEDSSTCAVDESLPWDNGSRLLCSDDGSKAAVVYPDILLEMRPRQRITCLEILPEAYSSQQTLPQRLHGWTQTSHEAWMDSERLSMGLALLPCVGEAKVYKRIGFVRWLRRSLLTSVEAVELEVI